MKRWVLLGACAIVAIWLVLDPDRREAATSAIGLATPARLATEAKPICASPVNPNVAAPLDCIPRHLANLPPDPGPAGKLTIDGVDVDNNGVRDDVQRWIAENWGHSALAVKALTIAAQERLRDVHYGGDLGKEEARKLGPESMRRTICVTSLATEELLQANALEKVRLQVTNTPERWKRARDFDQLFANTILSLPDDTPAKACGFDPAALAVQAGEQTWATKIAGERPEEEK